MTTVAVLADPPREGLVLPELVETSPLSAAEAASLYRAALGDVAAAVAGSGGDLLVNYRPDDSVPADYRTGASAEAEIRDALDEVVDDARFEPQVGETFSGRVGNTVTHLLEREGVRTAAVVEPAAVLLTRKEVDSAAMKLRRSEVVLGPSTAGRVYYAGFAAAVDFADAYAPPAVRTLTERASDAGHDVDFLPTLPVLETGGDLATVLSVIDARRVAGRPVPARTAAVLDEFDLAVVSKDGGGATVTRTDRS